MLIKAYVGDTTSWKNAIGDWSPGARFVCGCDSAWDVVAVGESQMNSTSLTPSRVRALTQADVTHVSVGSRVAGFVF